MNRQTTLVLRLLFLLLVIISCSKQDKVTSTGQVEVKKVSDEREGVFEDEESFGENETKLLDLEGIRERGELRVIVDNSSTSYFIYKGRRMGFEYELLKLLSEDLELELKIKVVENFEEAFQLLEDGRADLLANHLTITLARKQSVDFTSRLTQIKQVLVQRKPQNWRQMKVHEIEETLIRDVLELAGETVYVRKGSAFAERLQNLSEEIGEEIIIKEVDSVSSESQIQQVLDGEIKYTIADEDVAQINYSYHRDLDVETAVSFPQQIAWAVRKESQELKNAINNWMAKLKRTADFQTIYDRYFKYTKSQRRRAESEFSSTGGSISPYDDIIKKEAKRVGWDWRLLAAQIYQESKFDPKTVSWAGAEGLMQLTRNTQRAYGLKKPFDPQANIVAGVSHILWLEDYWKDEIEDEDELIKFILASYNTGHAHVADARRLAEKYGADSNVWYGNVEKYLLLKSKPKYYKDPVVRFGYARGIEPTNYVRDILGRYKEYQNFFPADSTDLSTSL
jgi:membrane-bound lytic murein transglycosylase F